MPLEHEGMTERIIGAAIEVHRALGPRHLESPLLESIHESTPAIELRERSIPFERQVLIPILYRGVEVGLHRLDFFIEREIVVELYAIKDVEDVHFAVVNCYLRFKADHQVTALLASLQPPLRSHSPPPPGFLVS